MGSSKLVIMPAEQYDDSCYIAWEIDGDEGGVLGQDEYTEADLKKAAAKGDDGESMWEHVKATLTAAKTAGVERRRAQYAHDTVYVWPTNKAARTALRAIKAAIKDRSDRPWPEWAVKAQGAGWTPPKGWQP